MRNAPPPPNDNCLLQAEETFKLTNNTDSAHTGNTPLQLKHAFFLQSAVKQETSETQSLECVKPKPSG